VIVGDPTAAAELAGHLASCGLAVETARDAADGLERVSESAGIDLALVEAHLRSGSGELLARVIDERAGVPVVTWSGWCTAPAERAVEIAATDGLVIAPATATAVRAAVDVVWRRHREQLEHIEEAATLRRRLEDRKIIERAKWVLVERLGISEPEAMRRLQKSARNGRRPLRLTAMSVLEASESISPELRVA
jgi:response regulator NasT